MTAGTRACLSCQTPLPDDAQFCMRCGAATPTEPGVPPRTMATGAVEVARVRTALGERYRVERVIGEGGMATVYLAEDLKHHRRVAVKVMRPELAATLGADRFLREVEIAAQLSHPHILPMYDSGEANGILYYVMPFVEGESLYARLKREGQMPVEEAVRLAREVAEALAHAHGHGIVHRDIKPANVLLSAGHALVADFGIARAAGAGGEALTRTGLAVGTPQYMSPEQATGSREVDHRADVYAVGAILYEMLAGEPPFTGPTAQAIVARSLTETPRPLSATRTQLPPQLSDVVGKALAKSPADRPQSAAELARALDGALGAGQSGGTSVPIVVQEGPSPTLVWGLFGIVTVAALAAVLIAIRRFGLPMWSLGLAALLLGIGAAVLVVTGRMERRRRAGEPVTGIQRLFTWTNTAIGGALALGLWSVVATGVAGGGAGTDAEGVRLAVLPFELRGATEDAYVADGIADEIRGKLTGLAGFRVTARASSDQYKGTSKTLQQIGHELGVDYVLTATVRLARAGSGGRIQVVPELIATRTGLAAWQQTFDAELTDVFEVQSQIASRVAGALGVALGGNEQRTLAERPTENLAAWDLYTRAKAMAPRDPASLRLAAGYLDQAAAMDTSFTEAYADLSRVLGLLWFNGTPDPALARRSREAAERALALEPNGARSLAAMGLYHSLVERNASQAEALLLRALQVAPNDPEILAAAASVESLLGRVENALVHIERARRLDPRSFTLASRHRTLLLLLRRYAEALEVGNLALAMEPADPGNIEDQAMIYLAQGDLAGAQAVVRSAPGELSQPALVAFLATYQDLWWILTDEQQQLVLRLPPSAFFDDPAAWGSVFMQVLWHRGDRVRARAYADTARAALEDQLRGSPDNPNLLALLGVALAYLGRHDEAIAAGEKSLQIQPVSADASAGAYNQHQLVRIYTMAGRMDQAMDRLEPLLRFPYYLSPGWLRIDPNFDPLRSHPRFQRLVAP